MPKGASCPASAYCMYKFSIIASNRELVIDIARRGFTRARGRLFDATIYREDAVAARLFEPSPPRYPCRFYHRCSRCSRLARFIIRDYWPIIHESAEEYLGAAASEFTPLHSTQNSACPTGAALASSTRCSLNTSLARATNEWLADADAMIY